jgi:hypothetical protein
MTRGLVTVCSLFALAACGDDPSSPVEPDAAQPGRAPDGGSGRPDASPRPFTVTVPKTGDVFELSLEDGPVVRITRGPSRLQLVQTRHQRSTHWGFLPGTTLGEKCAYLARLPVGGRGEAPLTAGTFHFLLELGPGDPELQGMIGDELERLGWLAPSAVFDVHWPWGAVTAEVGLSAVNAEEVDRDRPGHTEPHNRRDPRRQQRL